MNRPFRPQLGHEPHIPVRPAIESVHVDCDRCVVRSPQACSDCVVSVLIGMTPDGVELDHAERDALDVLADEGLVPPLRLVTPPSVPVDPRSETRHLG